MEFFIWMSRNRNVKVEHTKGWDCGLNVPLNWTAEESHPCHHISAIRREPRQTRHTAESERPALRSNGVIQAVEMELVDDKQMQV